MAEKFDSLGIRAIFMELAPDSQSERQAAANALNLGVSGIGAPLVGGGTKIFKGNSR